MEDHTLAVTALFLRTEQTVLTAHFKIASLNHKRNGKWITKYMWSFIKKYL